MHILRTGGKYAREQQRLYEAKAVAFVLTGIILLILLSHVWILSFVFFGCGLYYFKRRSDWHKGIQGEKMVVEALAPLDNSYVLINDVLLPERKGNIDHILVGPNSVFVIETKSYKWHYLNRFPIRQAICSAVSLRYFLKEHIQLNIFIPAILVSTDPDATISQSSPAVNVVNLKNLCEFIKDRENKSRLDSEAKKRLIYEIMKVSNAMSQKEVIAKKWLLKYIGFLAAGLIIYIFYVFSGGDPYGKFVLVTQVVDGDTIRVGRGWRKTTVQFLGVDTPETVHPDKPVEFLGHEASQFTKKTLKGKKVHLEFEPLNQMDKYDRLLAYVYLSDGSLFNAELIKRGYARVTAPSYFRYYDEFHNYEREAVADSRGIWTTKVKNIQFPSEKIVKIIGNLKSKIYHLPGQANYEKGKEENQVYFDSEEEAIRAGYRKAKR
ncbi:MAG: thermonuclease family protein [Planctomycetota bacterium]|nr:thermonuclease family protein [Planctomycetota bacterium]MDE2217467.1 thermonuclease family protein [Planctomycetota bacterium]